MSGIDEDCRGGEKSFSIIVVTIDLQRSRFPADHQLVRGVGGGGGDVKVSVSSEIMEGR